MFDINLPYISDINTTMAEKIDQAWDIYKNQNEDKVARKNALFFLLYAFDIDLVTVKPSDINKRLIQLMASRAKYKNIVPEYIPGQSPSWLGLTPEQQFPIRTMYCQQTSNKSLQRLFAQNELLDVNNEDKIDDYLSGIKYFDSKARNQYRVQIYDGKFYQSGKLFDTENYLSHFKQGFAAFTININGELSVFNHDSGISKILHSSMNAGRPVVCAGEIAIQNGRLLAITTYSGHYQPSMYNVFRALDYFSERGVDIIDTTVILSEPTALALKKINVKIRKHVSGLYLVSARDCYTNIKNALKKSLNNIKCDIASYQKTSFKSVFFRFKDKITDSDLTEKRKEISKKVDKLSEQYLNELPDKNDDCYEKYKKLLNELIRLKQENMVLSKNYNKPLANGRLYKKIDKLIEKTKYIISTRAGEQVRIINRNIMKAVF